ncbi:MAG: DNA/RNA non-specific endonuclease [Butyricicoccus sp.]|nr:DNA/RNA non-specific endonuclease [Butyricicoccus sp.]
MKTIAKWTALVVCFLFFSGCAPISVRPEDSFSLDAIPAFSGEPYVVIDDNQPHFDETNTDSSFESYSDLDALGRCGTAYANIGSDLMPTEERESISNVKPSGWVNREYDADLVDGRYLYNRCHLIGYQLTGENANEKNLITGTRYLNVEGMLPFENMVADYIKETDNHVLYRVTPIFEGDNLVASGVHMEALSVEDDGEGICFNIYAYNNQPGITIDYATGDNWLEGEQPADSSASSSTNANTYILNTNSKKFHTPDCSNAETIKDANRQTYQGSREDLINQGYSPCGQCKP